MKIIDEILSDKPTDNKFIIDCFPYSVTDNEKFTQAEINYKKVFHKNHNKFCSTEKNFVRFITYLYLYSDMQIFINEFRLTPISFFKMIKIKNNIKTQEFSKITNLKQLEQIVKSTCRDQMTSFFYCKNFLKTDMTVYMSECFAVVLINENNLVREIEKIANACGLFVRKMI